MPIGYKKVFPTIQVGIQKTGAPPNIFLPECPYPSRSGKGREKKPPLHRIIPIKHGQFVLVVRHPKSRLACPLRIPGVNSHASIRVAAVIPRKATHQPAFLQPDLARNRLVQIEKIVGCVVGHIDVGLPVPIHIHHHHPQPLALPRPSAF